VVLIGSTCIIDDVIKRNLHIILIISVLVTGCVHRYTEISVNFDRIPEMFPDYTDVKVPYNIAPLNFRVEEGSSKIFVSAKGKNLKSDFMFKGDKVVFPLKKWKKLMKDNRDGSIDISIKVLKGDTLKSYRSFKIFVSGSSIDDYLVYRLLMPGFQNWNQMGIYQRSLASFKSETIIDSHILPGTCMNCHTFAMNDPDNMILHLRESYGGTILYSNNKVEKLNTKAGKMFGNAAFPYWHPSKRYIAFSVNKVNQVFHAIGTFRASAVDLKSDIFVYDIEKNKMLTSPLLSSGRSFETFPCFSPDGMTLYFCTADSLKMPEKFDDLKYSLCSISFDPESGRFGEKADTVISGPLQNKSISLPRISPDGRFLMYVLSDYGCFPSYNPEADLYLMDLKTRRNTPMETLNSGSVESWHSWSSNGRWVAFSSRRENGLHSNIYLAYIDDQGNASKPFILPQEDPDFYDEFLFSFNVPELVKSKVRVDPYEIEKIAKKGPAIQVMTESGH
jgi:hypothetical protein